MSRKILFCFFLVLTFSTASFAGSQCSFKGDFDFLHKVFWMQINFKEKESIAAQLKFLVDDSYYFNADLAHLNISKLDLSTKLESSGRLEKDSQGNLKTLKGWFWSNYSLVNYKPFKEMSGAFELDEKSKRLSVKSFVWGGLEVNGSVDLISPYKLSLAFMVNDIEIKDLALLLGVSLQDFEVEGLVNGKLKIEGPIFSPKIKGQLKASNGSINDFKYQDIFVNFEGSYPLLNIVDSGIVEESGLPYNLEGRLDLSELNNFYAPGHAIRVSLSGDKNFNWQSWKIRRRPSSDNTSSLEFEYKLKPNSPFGIRFEDNQGILGLEQKIRF